MDGREAGPSVLGDAPAQTDAEARRLRASLRRALFAVEADVEIARYVVVDVLGRGGIGVVYRAWDPTLERHVALKVLALGGQTHVKERMLREARAMAALSDPHLVPVFDVGEDGDEVYIAMELVEGGTLRDWLATARRPREIVAAFVDAGQGLVAAHRAGLVHRDFKPRNVLVGPGPRMRVADFGLVHRVAEDDPLAIPASSRDEVPDERGSGDAPLTQGVVGTPGYMAPEQRANGAVDARADQYAFCVALCEALTGTRPANAADAHGLLARASRWRLAIVRGLSADPADRWPDLASLLRELRRSPATRSAWMLAGFAALVAARVAWPTPEPPVTTPECTASPATLSAAARDAAAERFQSLGPRFADEVWPRVDAALQLRIDQLAASRTAACRADRAATSAACFARADAAMVRLAETFATADVHAADAAVVAAMRLPDPRACASVSRQPPGDPESWAATLAVLEQSATALDAAEYDAALTHADAALRSAELQPAPALIDRARSRRAEALWRMGRAEEAEAAWSRAALDAEAGGRESLSAWAAIRLMWLNGVDLRNLDAAMRWDRHARAAVERLGGDLYIDTEREQALAEALVAAGRFPEALPLSEHALQSFGELFGPTSPRVGSAELNLGRTLGMMGDNAGSSEHLRNALRILVASKGPEHPDVGIAHANLGTLATDDGDYDAAKEHLERALEIKRSVLADDHPEIAMVLHNLGRMKIGSGDLEGARTDNEAALAIVTERLPPDHPGGAYVRAALAEVARRQGRFAAAETLGRQAAERFGRAFGPESRDVAAMTALRGRVALAQRRFDDAVALLDRALAMTAGASAGWEADEAEILEAAAEAHAGAGDLTQAAALRTRAAAMAAAAKKSVAPK